MTRFKSLPTSDEARQALITEFRTAGTYYEYPWPLERRLAIYLFNEAYAEPKRAGYDDLVNAYFIDRD